VPRPLGRDRMSVLDGERRGNEALQPEAVDFQI
jgi:hypothetical protein